MTSEFRCNLFLEFYKGVRGKFYFFYFFEIWKVKIEIMKEKQGDLLLFYFCFTFFASKSRCCVFFLCTPKAKTWISATRTSQFSKLQIFAKSAIFEISIREMTTSILESADSDEMNSSLRGTQNKRNAHLGVILESLIFSEIQNRKNSGIFQICGISRYPHDRPCVTLWEAYMICIKILYF